MYEKQIARGVMVLNTRRPGWYEGLGTLDVIDMVSPGDCVLGQIFGNYFGEEAAQLVEFPGITPRSAFAPNLHEYNAHMAQYGFSLPTSGNEQIDDGEEWKDLSYEWREVLYQLQRG